MSPNQHLLIVDDDALTREVIALVAEEAGFQVATCDSGEEALAVLALGTPASALLVDMQMPGLSGDPLGERLRRVCASGTLLIAMSGTPVAAPRRRHFDRFLLKPFQFEELTAVLDGAPRIAPPPEPDAAILHLPTFHSLAGSMPRATLNTLYGMCLRDAETRLHGMVEATASGDPESFRRGAHAIKGGCGMVGALELAAWAGRMEQDGPPPIDHFDPFAHFTAASARLRSMLDSQTEQPAPSHAAQGN